MVNEEKQEEEEDKSSSSPFANTPVKEEKLKLLRREEIKTMQKDLSRLRETEAREEKERITVLKLEKIKKETEEKKKIKAKTEVDQHPGILIPKSEKAEKWHLKKLSSFKKVLVRGIIIAVLFSIIGFLVWILVFNKPKEKITQQEIITQEEEIIPELEEEKKPEIFIPTALIPVKETKTPEISKNEQIPGIIEQLMTEEITENSFLQIAIKNTEENRLSSLKDLSDSFQIEVPEEIFQKLESNYTLAFYSQKQGKRIVFITKIKEKEGLANLLEEWGKNIEKEGVFVSGKEIPALVPYFKKARYKEADFQYQTFSEDGFGICYSLFNNYFILTTSGESILKVIDELTYKYE